MTDNAVLLPFLDTEDEHSIKTTPRELLLQNASNTLLARNKELTAPQYLQHKNIKDIVFHRENTYFTDDSLYVYCYSYSEQKINLVYNTRCRQLLSSTNLLAVTENDELVQLTPYISKPLPSDERVIKLHSGFTFTIIETVDKFYGLGDARISQLPLRPQAYPIPTLLDELSKYKIRKMFCGGFHTIFQTENDEWYGFGYNSSGRLGMAGTQNQNMPIRLPHLDSLDIVNMSCGRWHTVAVTSTGVVYTWGAGDSQGTGQGGKEEPTKLPLLHGINIVQTYSSAHSSQNFAVSVQGDLYAFGCNNNGELGIGKQGLVCSASDLGVVEKICLGIGYSYVLVRRGKPLVFKQAFHDLLIKTLH